MVMVSIISEGVDVVQVYEVLILILESSNVQVLLFSSMIVEKVYMI